MNRSIRRVCQGAIAAVLVCGVTTLASAAPLSPSRFEVSYNGSGQMTVDVYGGYFDDVKNGKSGDFFVAGDSGWDPIVFGQSSGYGSFEGMTVFENFVRYTYSSSSGPQGFVWTTPATNNLDVPSPAAVPEPGSMMLLGTGLLGLATAARRRMGRARA